MPTTTTKRDHAKAVIEANLTAAWLRRCGPSGVPGEWSSMEVVPILDDDYELELRAMWCRDGEHGRSWSAMFAKRHDSEWWSWSISRVDENTRLTRAASDAIDDLNASYDEHSISFLSEGNHQERPAVPDEVIDAWLILGDDASYEMQGA